MLTSVGVLGLAGQRLAELRLAGRNTAELRSRGATESGAGHYPLVVALHVGWLAATLVEGRRATRIRRPAAAVFVVAQLLRGWAIHSLGRQWTTRVIVDPQAPAVTSGPYRFLRHPNYVAVALEVAAFPSIFGARRTAVVSSAANAALLWHRIGVEDAARTRS